MTADDEYAELVCPLPVLRIDQSDDIQPDTTAVYHCGEQLFVNHTEGRYLLAGGECEGAAPTWEVVCGNGHTLLVPDTAGNDYGIPFDPALVQEALEKYVGVLVAGGGAMALKPLPGGGR